MISVQTIDHVVFRVKDMARMISFYEDVLGARTERRVDELGLVQLRAGECLIDLIDCVGKLGQQGGAPPGEQARNVDHICFRVSPWDGQAILEFLKSRAISDAHIAERYGAEGFGPSIYLADPEGNRLELKGPPDSVGG